MKFAIAIALTLATLAPQAARADAPDSSLRPVPRPGAAVEVSRAAPPALVERIVADVQNARTVAPPPMVVLAGVIARSPRPEVRPQTLQRREAVIKAGFRSLPKGAQGKGAICGDSDIRGSRLSPIGGRLRGCGIADPVRVTAVSGVVLSTPATMDCGTAKALKSWIERGVQPVVGTLGGGVASLQVAASYSCRGRNNVKGAKISEHGKGRAIDISAINLRNGAALSVESGWRNRKQAGMMKMMHRAACGPFGTVLGPNADRHHQDHFHLDTARHRNGSYCK